MKPIRRQKSAYPPIDTLSNTATLLATYGIVAPELVGSWITCGISAAETAFCWGGNSYGQIGNGTTQDSYYPVQVLGEGGAGGLRGLVGITTGTVYSSCAVSASGHAYSWGAGMLERLGDNSSLNSTAPVAVVNSSGEGNLS